MIRTYYKILFTIFTFVLVCDLQAQNLDSLSVVDAEYDSILRSDVDEMNVLFYKHRNDILINNLGPFGSPFYYPSSFFLKRKVLYFQKSTPLKLDGISGFRPYTNVTYINASRKEQHFYINHIQEFGKLLLLDFDFRKISSPGAYDNQEANNTTFVGNLEYKSKKDNYRVQFSTGIYRNFYEENGGLLDVSDYESMLFDEARNYSVNLQSSNSFIKKYKYKLGQRIDLFRLKKDSIGYSKIYLKHEVGYETSQRVFFDNDPLSSIYDNIYIDSTLTIDSIYNENFSNTGFVGFKNRDFSFELFAQYDQLQYEQSNGVDAIYHNTYAGLLSNWEKDYLSVDLIGKYSFDGYTKGDVESKVELSYERDKYTVTGGVSYFLNEADLKYVYYNSNHFEWTNTSLEKQSILDFDVSFKLKKLKLEFSANTKILNNTLYYDSLAMANQDRNGVSISTFSLAKNYKLLNFHFRTALIYQLTSNEILFPLPEMVGRQIIYYQKNIFKGALKFQFGVGASYSTDYYGYAYMPALGEFYVQQNSKLGYYPKIDVFINTHLKRAQIFLKYEHINAGNSLEKSYMIPGYPPMAKSLKFGVSWNMFD